MSQQILKAALAANTISLVNNEDGTFSILKGEPGSTLFKLDANGNLMKASSVVVAESTGYSTGSGGTVTQLTDKGTAVTLDKPTGRITMHNASLAAGTTVNFILNNSLITAKDVLIANIVGGVTGVQNYNVWFGFNSAGSIQVYVRNISAGSLAEAVQIQFAIIKGATS